MVDLGKKKNGNGNGMEGKGGDFVLDHSLAIFFFVIDYYRWASPQ